MPSRQVTSLPVHELSVAAGNWDSSRAPIDTIVIHTMVGTVQSANARFNDASSQVSAHYGVSLDGLLYHWVDESNTAYHAGDYVFNQRSIGIEHEDNGNYNGVRTNNLYSASAQLVADICHFYSIPCDRTHIRKHSEVSDKPTGCPDALDIDRIIRQAAASLNPPTPGFNDQTKIPLGGDFGEMELGAIRSQLTDDKRLLASAKVNANSNNEKIAELMDHLSAQASELSDTKDALAKAKSDYAGAYAQANDLSRQLKECQANKSSPVNPGNGSKTPAAPPSGIWSQLIEMLRRLGGGAN